jgi:serine/threonine-protein kinase
VAAEPGKITAERSDRLLALAVSKGWVRAADAAEAQKSCAALNSLGLTITPVEVLCKHGRLSEEQLAQLQRLLFEAEMAAALPGYELLEKMGVGAVGTLYKARQTSGGRLVTIKILSPYLAASSGFVERFFREGRLAAQLDHANLPKLIEVGEAQGLLFFVSEHVEGRTYRQILEERKRVSEREVIEVGLGVAQALEAAAAAGLLHRAIKPENIVRTPEDQVKLCELGLARPIEDDSPAAMMDEAFGAPLYLAPEAARGRAVVDSRGDIYSLGATLYHLLTGAPLFQGPTVQAILDQHRSAQAPHPQERVAGVLPGLVAVLRMMLAKDPAERYADATALRQDLEALRAWRPPAKALGFRGESSIGERPGRAPTAPSQESRLPRKTRQAEPLGSRRPAGLIAALGIAVVAVIAVICATMAPNARRPSPNGDKPDQDLAGPAKGSPALTGPQGSRSQKVTPPPDGPSMPPPPPPPGSGINIREWLKQPGGVGDVTIAPAKTPGAGQEAAAPRRCAIPGGQPLHEQEARLKESFAAEYQQTTPEARTALAAKLLKKSQEGPDPVARYAALRESRDLALRAGNLDAARAACDELVKSFEHQDASALPPPPAAAAPSATLAAALAILEQLIAAGDYDRLGGALQLLAGEAGVSDPAWRVFAKTRLELGEEMAKAWPEFQAAVQKLTQAPADPAASLAAGRFLCFLKGDWAGGIPHLARGSDPVLRDAAEKDGAVSAGTAALPEAANAWWEAADRQTGVARMALRTRACALYRQVQTQDAASKSQIETRLARFAEEQQGLLAQEGERVELARAKKLTEADIQAEATKLIGSEYDKYAAAFEQSRTKLTAAEADLRERCWVGKNPHTRYFDSVRYNREYTLLVQNENAVLDPLWRRVEELRQQFVDKYSAFLREDPDVRPQYLIAARTLTRLFPKKH